MTAVSGRLSLIWRARVQRARLSRYFGCLGPLRGSSGLLTRQSRDVGSKGRSCRSWNDLALYGACGSMRRPAMKNPTQPSSREARRTCAAHCSLPVLGMLARLLGSGYLGEGRAIPVFGLDFVAFGLDRTPKTEIPITAELTLSRAPTARVGPSKH